MKRLLLQNFVAVALFAALVALGTRNYVPPLPNPLALDLVLDAAAPEDAFPIVVSGRVSFGDFLWVQHVGPHQVRFCYDSWGHPGVASPTVVSFTPGTPLHLLIELPAFTDVHESLIDPPGRAKVTANGAVVFDAMVDFHKRAPADLWLGENPLGGTACGPRLAGRILWPDGREIRANIFGFLSTTERIFGWFRHSRQGYAVILFCAAFAFGWIKLDWFRLSALRARASTLARALAPHRWFVGTTVISALSFAWMITRGSFVFPYDEPLSSFYDFQMASLLHGHLDVPDEAIGGEAFVYGGKIYGYFGPTPALLRLPFVLFGFAFGELSRLYMLGYFVAALVASYLLLLQALRLAGRTAPPSPLAVVLFVAHAGLGSTLYFLGSRSYVYHEAILCGAMFALFSCYFALRHLESPSRRFALIALACGLASLHARPPTGLFSLTFLGCVAATQLFRVWFAPKIEQPRSQIRNSLTLGILCVLGVFTFNALSYLKFESFEGAPLRYSRPYDAERLAKIDGKSFHLANLPFGFDNYLVRLNLRVEPLFPYVYLGATTPGRYYPKAKIDLPDHTNALPYSMPGLFALATLGCAAACFFVPRLRVPVLVTWAAIVPMTLALFAAIATAQRYTGDFVPALIVAGALGLAPVEAANSCLRFTLRALFVALTICAVLVTFALTLHYQRDLVWGVPESDRQAYQAFRHRLGPLYTPSP